MAEPLYRDEGWLRQKYATEELSTLEIADICGVTAKTIWNWLTKFGVETRGPGEWTKKKASLYTERRTGYERWTAYVDGETKHFSVHRLLAISEFGIEKVKGKHVHHPNEIPWDNRPGNIKLVTIGEHNSIHKTKP